MGYTTLLFFVVWLLVGIRLADIATDWCLKPPGEQPWYRDVSPRIYFDDQEETDEF